MTLPPAWWTEEQRPTLAARQWHQHAGGFGSSVRCAGHRTRLRSFNRISEPFDGPGGEERGERHVAPEASANLGDEFDRKERMSAEFEEVVVDADTFCSQHVLPDAHELQFDVVARHYCGVAAGAP